MASLVAEGLLHPNLGERIPPEITHRYSHQERAIRAIAEGRTTLVTVARKLCSSESATALLSDRQFSGGYSSYRPIDIKLDASYIRVGLF